MTDTLLKIRSLYESLSQTQRQLADYILDHGDDIPFLSVHGLARAAGVSVATISRFAREVGHNDFKEFKTQLGKDSLASVAGIYRAITRGDSDEDVIEKVFLGNIKSLEETLKIVNRDDLIRAARTIAISERTVFLGVGSSGNIARDAALRFAHLDVQAEAYCDSYEILVHAARIKKGDVAFGISHTGRSTTTVEALELATSNGATAIGMSNFLKSPLHEKSSIFLCTSFPESRVEAAALSSLIAQTCLIDVLYLLVARYKAVSLKKAERLNARVEEVLRLPAKGRK
jgi:RpiR family transcriptional regulator, carbohydrate utilization regulator